MSAAVVLGEGQVTGGGAKCPVTAADMTDVLTPQHACIQLASAAASPHQLRPPVLGS